MYVALYMRTCGEKMTFLEKTTKNSIPVFGVLALCKIKSGHIRARAIDQSVLYSLEVKLKLKGPFYSKL